MPRERSSVVEVPHENQEETDPRCTSVCCAKCWVNYYSVIVVAC